MSEPRRVQRIRQRSGTVRYFPLDVGPGITIRTTRCRRHCLCIEEGLNAKRGGLILVTRRCCRCDMVVG